MWRLFTLIKFMTVRDGLMKVTLKSRMDFSKSYFAEDLPAIKEQCLLMLKTRLDTLITDVTVHELTIDRRRFHSGQLQKEQSKAQ